MEIAGLVKDYQMPASEQRLSDDIIVWGRRQIILRGGNRGVDAAVIGLLPLLWGFEAQLSGLFAARR